ncbi:MAG: Tex-like N-terminal domain-containing protein, partial [Planctomycetota bacterium]
MTIQDCCHPRLVWKFMTEDIVVIARDLKLPPEKVQHAVELLDAGNTIPFIARFRKDQTGGLDPEQVLAIKQRVSQLRALAERKSFVLKSIEQQGVLTEALAKEISQAISSRRVEDLYLPFKAKKQTLALTARQQGLEPLAQEILSGEKSESELAARALDFVRVDKGLASVVDVMSGVGHLIAEQYSERSDLRRELRRIIWATGSLCCKSTKSNEAVNAVKSEAAAGSQATTETESATAELATAESADAANALEHVASEATAAATEPEQHAEHLAAEIDATDVETTEVLAEEESGENAGEESQASEEGDTPETKPEATGTEPNAAAGSKSADKNQAKKTGKAKAPANPFADYEDFSESLRKIPNHRILAINRGERAGLLKAKVKAEQQPLEAKLFELLIPAEHPSKAFLIECARDAFSRMIFPSLEREIRRELTETAEQHALRVFSENLKALLLQPPVRGKRILAIDPGYKSG